MIQLVTNTRGAGAMTTQDYSKMSGPEMVKAYNEMATSSAGKELGVKTTTKFKDLATGAARCKSLASSIKARKEGFGKEKVQEKKAGTIVELFKLRAGTNRVEMIRVLHDSLGKQVRAKDLFKRCKFSDKVSLSAVADGLEWRIDKSKLPYVIKREKINGEASFGLHVKK